MLVIDDVFFDYLRPDWIEIIKFAKGVKTINKFKLVEKIKNMRR
jgi:hypothetical protein